MVSARRISITHIINGLYTGGAEMMLYKLLSSMDRERFKPQVITLIDGGDVRDKIANLGIEVYSLGISRRAPGLAGVGRLIARLRQSIPDLIQTWMYHANLLGSIAQFIKRTPIVWNIRCSKVDEAFAGQSTIWTAKAGATLSHVIPSRIVCGSVSAWQDHIEMGYEKEKMIVIPNGFDLERFCPDADARLSVRRELGISAETEVVGIFTRFDPFKDPENFVRAAGVLHAQMPEVRFVMCGFEISWDNKQLVEWIEQAGIRNNCFLLGQRQDIPQLMTAMDTVVSASQSEGFPNVLGEAMACGVPCVATAAGDSALIIGDTGKVVPIKEPEALAQACESLLKLSSEERQLLGQAARRRIAEQYSLSTIVHKYEQLYQELLTPRNGKH